MLASMDELHSSATPLGNGEAIYGYGLTEREVLRLREIIRTECGVELTMEAAWVRAIELVALARMIAEADLPAEVRR